MYYVCMYVRMYVCMYVCMYKCMCVLSMYVCMCVIHALVSAWGNWLVERKRHRVRNIIFDRHSSGLPVAWKNEVSPRRDLEFRLVVFPLLMTHTVRNSTKESRSIVN